MRQLLAEQLAVVAANEPRARRGSVEGLHDVRVALRRMRTLAATFAPVNRRFLERLDGRASKTCDRMGDARDLDVWIDLFRDLERAGGVEGMTLRARRATLAELRAARAKLAGEALTCPSFRRVKEMLEDFLAAPGASPRKGLAGPEALMARRMRTVRGLIAERYRKVGGFSSKPAHSLRRSGRRLRYLAEFFAARIGPRSVRAGMWITRAQAALGKMHDCDSALELSKGLPTGRARAAVRKGLRKRRAAYLAKFKAAWKRYADGKLQRDWARELDKAAKD